MQQYRQQYPDMSLSEIQNLARSTLQTGYALPTVSIAEPGDIFYKLIPASEARGPSQGTVCWMDESQLNAVMSGNVDIGAAFGLPNKTTASSYHLYKTTVADSQAPLIFRSNIAPAVEMGCLKLVGKTRYCYQSDLHSRNQYRYWMAKANQ